MPRHQKSNRAPRRRKVQWEGQARNSQLSHDVGRTNSHAGVRESFLKLRVLLPPSTPLQTQENSLLGLEQAEACSSSSCPFVSPRAPAEHHLRPFCPHHPCCGSEDCGWHCYSWEDVLNEAITDAGCVWSPVPLFCHESPRDPLGVLCKFCGK